jgi:RNA polymerase sigma-70 factor (ECF subfamily)
MDNDYEILNLLRQGSADAFKELYNRHSGRLYNFIRKINNGNTYQTEELVQQTFIKVWENRAQINPEKSFSAFLCAIAKNLLLNELKHQTIEFIYHEYIRQQNVFDEWMTDREINRKFLEEIIDKLAEQLPPARRQIFLLSKKEGYSVKEIARKLNLATTTVQTQLTKALEFMRERLRSYSLFAALALWMLW